MPERTRSLVHPGKDHDLHRALQILQTREGHGIPLPGRDAADGGHHPGRGDRLPLEGPVDLAAEKGDDLLELRLHALERVLGDVHTHQLFLPGELFLPRDLGDLSQGHHAAALDPGSSLEEDHLSRLRGAVVAGAGREQGSCAFQELGPVPEAIESPGPDQALQGAAVHQSKIGPPRELVEVLKRSVVAGLQDRLNGSLADILDGA